ncbi:MAG: protein kinase [Deltaproteobacteria bacterium]|nr:protein kinase [Deltaproteobacteria bacterium]
MATEKPASTRFTSSLAELKAVGRYEIVRKLGQGGAGVVYLGQDPFIKRNVAIKLTQPASDNIRKKFFIEAQSAGRLNHPNIVNIHDAGVHNDFFYITMEYIEGPTLEGFCRKDNLLPLNKVVEIIGSACYALDYAHKNGVIHRDIKPSNIMLDKSGVTKITDFGTAQMTEQTAEMGIFGTPSYMAPEQIRDGEASSESDIFSLGCILYELLTGERAFGGDNFFSIMYKTIKEEPASVLSLRPDLPKAFDLIIKKALAKDINERYQACMDFAYHLRTAAKSLTQSVKKGKSLIDYVHHVPFFKNFTRGQVKELIAASSIIKVRKGKVILAEGESDDDTFYIILSGKVRVTRGGTDLAVLGIGECFGEMAYIARQTRVANVVAETDCFLMKLSATLLNRASKSIQILFLKQLALTLVRRFSKMSEKAI